jgi:hypothetical protein
MRYMVGVATRVTAVVPSQDEASMDNDQKYKYFQKFRTARDKERVADLIQNSPIAIHDCVVLL